jgi:hypothetical protein
MGFLDRILFGRDAAARAAEAEQRMAKIDDARQAEKRAVCDAASEALAEARLARDAAIVVARTPSRPPQRFPSMPHVDASDIPTPPPFDIAAHMGAR